MTLSELLNTSGKTQAELAPRFGVFQTTVGNWMRGVSIPPRTRFPAIAAGLELTLEQVEAAVEADRQHRLQVARSLMAKATNAPAAKRKNRAAADRSHGAQPNTPGAA
jgi:transcriptional regulator with XRE-family HTH domain